MNRAQATKNRRVIYQRQFPYGAPVFIIRGGATKHPEVIDFLKGNGFEYESNPTYGWKGFAHATECKEILGILEEEYDCEIFYKKTMDANYILDGFNTPQPEYVERRRR